MKRLVLPKITEFTSWDQAAHLSDFSYPWRTEPVPETIFYAYHDEEHLHFRFVAYGPPPLVHVESNHKLEVIHSERIEIFFRSNEAMRPYYCLEMDPHGRVLDYRANHYREFERDWQWPSDLLITTSIEDGYYSFEGAFRLDDLRQLDLLKGREIETGLYRGHCSELKDGKGTIKWISWVDSGTENPDFHVPTSFGLLELA